MREYNIRFNNKAVTLHALDDMVTITTFVDRAINKKALQSFPNKILTSINKVNNRI